MRWPARWPAAPPWIDATRVVLAGLPPLIQAELLYGLQERCRRGSKTKPELLRTLCELLRNAKVESMLEFSTSQQLPWSQHTQMRTLRRQDSCALAGSLQVAVRQQRRPVDRLRLAAVLCAVLSPLFARRSATAGLPDGG